MQFHLVSAGHNESCNDKVSRIQSVSLLASQLTLGMDPSEWCEGYTAEAIILLQNLLCHVRIRCKKKA